MTRPVRLFVSIGIAAGVALGASASTSAAQVPTEIPSTSSVQITAASGVECTLFLSAFFSGVDTNGVVSGTWQHRATIECSSKILRMQIQNEHLTSPSGGAGFGSPNPASCNLCSATTSGASFGCTVCNGTWVQQATFTLTNIPGFTFSSGNGFTCTKVSTITATCNGTQFIVISG